MLLIGIVILSLWKFKYIE